MEGTRRVNAAMKRVFVRRLTSKNARAYRALLVEALILHSDCFQEDYRVEVARPLEEIEADLEDNEMFEAWTDEKLLGFAGYSNRHRSKLEHSGKVNLTFLP